MRKKLVLNKESIRALTVASLIAAVGGDGGTGDYSCTCGLSRIGPTYCQPATAQQGSTCAPNPTATCDGCTLITF